MNTEHASTRPDAASPTSGRGGVRPEHGISHWLRYVPPVAALGTAFVLQTIIVTDLLGGALGAILGATPGYILGLLFGLSVASCAEGGAAYLMDLYDKHLLARDSVWVLRVAMVGYVVGSGLAIHWWLAQRHLPTIMSWLLAGMSGSALFLWSRGARWRNREAMRAAGQIDPALPRLPLAAKILHPIRWAITLYLISWEPVSTTDEARERYREWRNRRGVSKTIETAPLGAAKTVPAGSSGTPEGPRRDPDGTPTAPALDTPTAPLSEPPAKGVDASRETGPGTVNGTPVRSLQALTITVPEPPRPDRGSVRPASPVTSDSTPAGTADDTDLLAVLRNPARVPREPDGTVPVKRAMRVLGVGRDRAIRLLDTLSLRRIPDPDDGSDTPERNPGETGSGDDPERLPEPLSRINGTPVLELIGAPS